LKHLHPYLGLCGRVLLALMSVAGGFLLLAAYGPGALALDNRKASRGADC